MAGGPSVTQLNLAGFTPILFDNLIYPNNDAGNGANNGQVGLTSIPNPAPLDNGGLLFAAGGIHVHIDNFGQGNPLGDTFIFFANTNGGTSGQGNVIKSFNL